MLTFWNDLDWGYTGLLLAILVPLAYFEAIIMREIFTRLIMFRRITWQNLSKTEASLFNAERRTTVLLEWIGLIVLFLTLEYAYLMFQIIAGRAGALGGVRDLTYKLLLGAYLWAFVGWYDYRRWKERSRTRPRQVVTHCTHYLYTGWVLLAVLFLVFHRM
jgi:hypothetical protein